MAPSATPSRMNSIPPAVPNPAWERGIKGETRPDGSFMPYLAPGTRSPLRVKEYGEKRREIDAAISNLKTRSTPLPDH